MKDAAAYFLVTLPCRALFLSFKYLHKCHCLCSLHNANKVIFNKQAKGSCHRYIKYTIIKSLCEQTSKEKCI